MSRKICSCPFLLLLDRVSKRGKEQDEIFNTSAVCSTLVLREELQTIKEVLMQEEVTQKTIALVIKTSKLNASVLKAAMRMYLNHRKQQAQNKQGKVSVKKLVGEGVGVSSIEVTDNNIKAFERVARKYNVDFAVKKDKTTDPPKYVVFFKGRDADVISQAFKEFVYGNEKKKGRTSVREKLNKFRETVSQDKNRERSREKNKDRGQSL